MKPWKPLWCGVCNENLILTEDNEVACPSCGRKYDDFYDLVLTNQLTGIRYPVVSEGKLTPSTPNEEV